MTIERFFIVASMLILALLVYGFALVIEHGRMRDGLYQACIDDKQPAYACYGFIYGGGVRR